MLTMRRALLASALALLLTNWLVRAMHAAAVRRVHAATAAGRKVLVTGGSSGLGRWLAVEFAAAGYSVYVTGRDEGRLQETLGLCAGPGAHRAFAFALEDRAALRGFAEGLRGEEFEFLVLNAGVGFHGASATLEEVEQVFAANLTSQAFLALALRYERLVCVASPQALLPVPRRAPYAASKAGLAHLARCLAQDGVPATVCYPRWFASGLRAGALGPAADRRPRAGAPSARAVARRVFADAMAERPVSALCAADRALCALQALCPRAVARLVRWALG